jgi:hypothetical protein
MHETNDLQFIVLEKQSISGASGWCDAVTKVQLLLSPT